MKMKSVIVSIVLSATMIFTPAVSSFASTETNVLVGSAQSKDVLVAELADDASMIVGEDTESPILKSNRYYYTVETKSSKPVSIYVSAAQAATQNLLMSALKNGLSGVLGALLGGGAGLAAGIATGMAADFFVGTSVRSGTYTGTAYYIVKYKVDSLTGTKTKYQDGVKVTLTHSGVTYTRTKWVNK